MRSCKAGRNRKVKLNGTRWLGMEEMRSWRCLQNAYESIDTTFVFNIVFWCAVKRGPEDRMKEWPGTSWHCCCQLNVLLMSSCVFISPQECSLSHPFICTAIFQISNQIWKLLWEIRPWDVLLMIGGGPFVHSLIFTNNYLNWSPPPKRKINFCLLLRVTMYCKYKNMYNDCTITNVPHYIWSVYVNVIYVHRYIFTFNYWTFR